MIKIPKIIKVAKRFKLAFTKRVRDKFAHFETSVVIYGEVDKGFATP